MRAWAASRTPHPHLRPQHSAQRWAPAGRPLALPPFPERRVDKTQFTELLYKITRADQGREQKSHHPCSRSYSPGLKGQKSVARTQDWGRQFFSVIQKLHPPQPSTHRKHTNHVSEIMQKDQKIYLNRHCPASGRLLPERTVLGTTRELCGHPRREAPPGPGTEPTGARVVTTGAGLPRGAAPGS